MQFMIKLVLHLVGFILLAYFHRFWKENCLSRFLKAGCCCFWLFGCIYHRWPV